MLETARASSLDDCVKLQHDTYSERATQLIPFITASPLRFTEFRSGRSLLQAWDCHVDADSAAAVLFEQWWQNLTRDTAKLLVANASKPPVLKGRLLIGTLEKPDQHFGPNPAAGRDTLLISTLDSAVSDLEKTLVCDKSGWSWGCLHSVDLKPPLAAITDAAAPTGASITGGRCGGDNATVTARWYRDLSHANVIGGAAFSMVLDVGDWDNSLVLHMPGQSGDPGSPHYRDLYERWLDGKMFPLFSPGRRSRR